MSVFKRWNGSQWVTIGPGVTSARFDNINNMIAPEYDPQKTYNVGDYVVQSDKLYRCINRIGTPQDWIGGNWREVKLGQDVTELRNDIVAVSNTQPTSENNRIWVKPDNNDMKIPLVEDVMMLPNPNDYGENDQIPRSTGTGIEWVDYGLPSDQQTEDAINAWLNAHPEATTTVQDGSLTKTKFSNTLQLETIKDYVTPEMFGAYADGEHDDTEAFQKAYNAVKLTGGFIVLPSQNYYLASGITGINHTGRKEVAFIGIGKPKITVASEITVFSVGDSNWITDLSDGYGVFILKNIFFECNDATSILIDNLAMRCLRLENVRVFKFDIGVRTTGSWSGSVYNATFANCNIGVEVGDRCNFQSFRGGFLACGIGIHYNNETYEITSNKIDHSDFEGCTYCIKVDSVGAINNITISNNNFETSTNAIYITNESGTSNKKNFIIINNNFYFSGTITIGTNDAGSYVVGCIFAGNTVATNTDSTILFGSLCPSKVFNCVAYANNFDGTSNNPIEFPTAGFTNSSYEKLGPTGAVMLRYPVRPNLPTNANDTKGVMGDIRYRENYLYIKTDTGWKRTLLDNTWGIGTAIPEAYDKMRAFIKTVSVETATAAGASGVKEISFTYPDTFKVVSVDIISDARSSFDLFVQGINDTTKKVTVYYKNITSSEKAAFNFQIRLLCVNSAYFS